jgi:hypothetical protein
MPNTVVEMLPPTDQRTLKNVIAVSSEENSANVRSTGASVAIRISTAMRNSGFSEPFIR